MASSSVGRKTTYSSTSASNLDNNLDALLDDLQTSISTPSRNVVRTSTPHGSSTRIIETSTSSSNSRRSPLRSASPMRSISPNSQGRKTTIEKYVSTGPAGTPSGIPGLEMLDAELQDVQPGQSKTVAYKQVSYHYDKKQEGNDLEPWIKTDKISKNDASIVDDFCERTFERSNATSIPRDSPDFAKTGKEIIYKADVSTKTIPTQQQPQPTTTNEMRSTERDFKYVKETRTHTEPSPVSPRKNIKTVRTDETEDLTHVEYLPSSTPIPANLAPGPNTKVTTTIKTYTYELPGAPETYIPPPSTTTTSVTKNINVDKSINYSLPRDTTADRTVTYHVEEQKSGVREYIPPPSPSTNRVHREEKVFVERRGYVQPSPPPPSTTTTLTRNEQYLQHSATRSPVGIDYPDHSINRTERVERVYQSEPQQPVPIPVTTEGTRTTVKEYEEHFSASRPPPARYYPESSQHSSTTRIYKYDEQQSLLPKPFPTSERPSSPRQQPPKRIEDLMASLSDTEEVVEVVEKRERKTTNVPIKKEVDFIPHTPSVVKSKNIAGPPVYYPPGSGEFVRREESMSTAMSMGDGGYSKKEEAMSAMSKSSGGWAKERAAWEYGSSNRSEEKTKTKKAVVPLCLPLCCALPCVIM